jgi:hypothetical protein
LKNFLISVFISFAGYCWFISTLLVLFEEQQIQGLYCCIAEIIGVVADFKINMTLFLGCWGSCIKFRSFRCGRWFLSVWIILFISTLAATCLKK